MQKGERRRKKSSSLSFLRLGTSRLLLRDIQHLSSSFQPSNIWRSAPSLAMGSLNACRTPVSVSVSVFVSVSVSVSLDRDKVGTLSLCIHQCSQIPINNTYFCTCMCAYIYIYIFIFIYLHICLYICISMMYIRIYVYIFVYIYMFAYIYAYIWFKADRGAQKRSL